MAVIIKCILPITCRLNTWFMVSDSRRSFMNGALKCTLFHHINLLLKRNCFCQCNYRLERKKSGANSSTYSICYDWNNQGLTAWQLSIGVYDWGAMISDATCVSIINYFIYSDWVTDFVLMNNDLALEIRVWGWGKWIPNSQKIYLWKIIRALSLHLKFRRASENSHLLAQICLRIRNWRGRNACGRSYFL